MNDAAVEKLYSVPGVIRIDAKQNGRVVMMISSSIAESPWGMLSLIEGVEARNFALEFMNTLPGNGHFAVVKYRPPQPEG